MENNKYKIKISFDEAIKEFEENLVSIFKREYTLKITEKSVDEIMKVSNEIYENDKKFPGMNTLIVGNVQSGKTATYLGMVAKFLDEDSNLCVVLPAVDKILFNQTYKRFKDLFSKKVTPYRVVEDEINTDRTIKKIVNQLQANEKVIILGLKNKNQIDKISSLISKINQDIKRPFIIDDEGDQASFDNIKEKDATATNKAIIKLINSPAKRFSFFSITATPMAQIFVDNEAAIKPDFAFTTLAGDGYTGLNYYHNVSDREVDYSIRIISDLDIKKLKEKKVRPSSLNEAVLYYLVSAAFLHARNGEIINTSFLVHTHKKNSDHSKINGWVMGALDSAIKDLENKKEKTIKKIKEIIKDSVINISEDEFDSFIKLVIKHANKTDVVIGNQENAKFKEVMGGSVSSINTIYIGSQMLQRGVTLPNLITTYFAYRTKSTANCDTVLQRARWFGYREDYKEISRIYLDKVSEGDFAALAEMNEDLFERLEELKSQNLNFVDSFEQSILLPYADMRATRETVAKNGRSKQWRTYSDTSVTSSSIVEELYERLLKNNKLKTIIKGLPFQGIKFETYSDVKDWMGDEIEQLYKELGITGSIRKDLEDFIIREKLDFAVVIMNSNTKDGVRDRKVYENNKKKTFSLSQGANNNYKGDRYWFKYEEFKNTFIIQIHRVRSKYEDDNQVYFKSLLVSPKRVIGDLIHKKSFKKQK